MSMDDNDAQMIFGDLGGLKFPDICLTGEEKPRKNLTQETCPDRGSNPGPLSEKRACYHLLHSGGLICLQVYTMKSTLRPRSRMWTCVVLLKKHIIFLSKKTEIARG